MCGWTRPSQQNLRTRFEWIPYSGGRRGIVEGHMRSRKAVSKYNWLQYNRFAGLACPLHRMDLNLHL